jgi:RNA polymerase sigma-70 factor, ECF subfamily
MDLPAPGHPPPVTGLSACVPELSEGPAGPRGSLPEAAALASVSFEAVYEESLDFVWRSLQSLGVRQDTLDDAVQDVFLVVHRRLPDFEARSSVRTWIFGIAIRVARDHRRRHQRKGGLSPLDFDVADYGPGPYEEAERSEALRELAAVLEHLDEDKREVFVLAELEQLTAPEIAAALSVNVNTIYSRIRAARREFDVAVARLRGGKA